MKGLKLDPTTLNAELLTFNTKLVQSCRTLLEIDQVDTWQTPKTEIYRQDKLRLYHCPAQSDNKTATPLLICYALVNRIYMVDLEPQRSLLRRLVEAGHEVYLIDWGYPDAADRYLDLDDYVNDYLDSCVDQVRSHAGCEQVNLLGICQGGTLGLCYTALQPKKINNLITMVTPVDFHTDDNLLAKLSQYVDIDLAVDTYGNIPGEFLNDSYNALLPMRLGVQKNLLMPNQLADRDSALSFLRMEQWIYDSPDQAGEAFREFVQQFFRENRLISGNAMIGDQPVDLQRIDHPVLNIYGTFDHLVPPSASIPLQDCIASSDYQALAIDSGHIGVFVSGKSQHQVAPAIDRWLRARD
ncbi:class III poly(R)-hydroxyalkanoic acid synthase subunit PhaC [Marinobacterium arenosum]|uniref:class III poly(R)-hydroxyalkanoic acid synthase subunit PhaC n=1 Tax=Marinobacterium arenosum TaxID=2862496 RepID=UPI001C94A5FF|nr:class III poly(R)-hydroxyalkanoic acid synthase subunit PhaC [Marinobacterium arenosum]MBY4675158.1 class III poly(R)-hydroxyalkanoic acid synthase subunit PhaC [Marinobacterium arenosum]